MDMLRSIDWPFLPIRNLCFRYITFLKYCCVGCLVTGMDFVIFSGSYYLLHLGSVPSKLLAFSGAVILGFWLHRIWTFRSRSIAASRQFARFLTVSLTGAGLSAACIFIQIDLLHFHPLFANATTSMVVLSWNFLSNKLWSFRIVRRPKFHEETPQRDLSLVIPAYNEEERIGTSIEENIAYLSPQDYSWEILVIDDGSYDRTTGILQPYIDAYPRHIRLLRLPRNRGKGAAVQMGVINAIGRYIIIADADNATPIEELGRFMAEAKEDEILIGSRYVAGANIEKKQPALRVWIGRLGNRLIRLFLIDGIADTQCGFKLFPAALAKDLFSRQRISGWAFDMEILSMAQGMGLRIRERGVTWRDVPGSRLRPLRAALKTLIELVIIKINIWSGAYE